MKQTTTITPALQTLIPGKQWVCFDTEKQPISPITLKGVQGKLVEGNPDWVNYHEALAVWKANSNRGIKGIGREFIKRQGITGIDLDKGIVNGQIEPWAQAIIDRFNSYTEYSPSGRGVHIWVYGSIPKTIAPNKPEPDGIEMYDQGRYFTITGKHLPGTPETIEDRQEQLTALYREVVERRKPARKPHKATRATGGDTPYGLKALADECSMVASTQPGARNDQLNASAYSLGRLIAGHELTQSTVETDLSAAAGRAGLSDQEIERTIRSGIEGGLLKPRSAPLKERTQEFNPSRHAANAGSNGNGNHSNNGHQNTTSDLCSFSADDAGNGDAMLAIYGKDFLWCASVGWFCYVDTHWKHDPDGSIVKRSAVETLRVRRVAAVLAEKEPIVKCTKADESRVNGCVSRFKTLVSVSIESFDNDPDKLNCKNGVLDLRTGLIEEHSREQRFTYCIPVEYKQTDYAEWLDFLQGVISNGQDVMSYLQMAIGYSFTGHTREEILFYLYGPTRSGKGTFAETIMALLPRPLATMVDFNSFTTKREGDVSNFDLAPLKPARLIFASESNKSQSLNPAKIKALTGGDHVTCCFKHRDFFTYHPQYKIWMMSNHPVNGDPEDDALWGRVRVIEFPTSYLGIEDKSKKARLKEPEVLQGVLYWIVQGAMKWYSLGAQGLVTPDAIEKITQEQRNELDYVQQWLEESCKDDALVWESNEKVNASYIAWCDSNNVQFKKGPKALAQSLKARGYEVSVSTLIEGKTKRGVKGLSIKGGSK